MAAFLKRNVLGGNNAAGIYVLEPMTHLQTANNYPDMVALETAEQFAVLNQIALSFGSDPPVAANSYPLNVSYSTATLPDGVAEPLFTCPSASGLPQYSCQGLDFRDLDSANETLVSDIITRNVPGFYIFSAPWETVSALMANINRLESYDLSPPAHYLGPNYLYAISIAGPENATLFTYDINIQTHQRGCHKSYRTAGPWNRLPPRSEMAMPQ